MARNGGKITMTLATAPAPPDRRTVARTAPGAPDVRQWFRISNLTNEAATRIDIYEEIGGWGVSASEFVRELRAIATPEVHLHVNSPGGSVFDGVAIFNALVQHPARVTAYVDGLAASAASFIVQSADDVVMNPGSMMMVHDAIGMTWGNAHDHTTMAGLLAQVSDSIAELYAARAGGTAADWRAVMENDGGEGRWYTAEQAVAAGLADRVHGTEPTAGEQAATGEPPSNDGDESPTDRYDNSSIAAGHRMVLAHRDNALQMAPPPAGHAADGAIRAIFPDAIAWFEQEAAPVSPPPAAMTPPRPLDDLIAAWHAADSPYTADPFIPFQ